MGPPGGCSLGRLLEARGLVGGVNDYCLRFIQTLGRWWSLYTVIIPLCLIPKSGHFYSIIKVNINIVEN